MSAEDDVIARMLHEWEVYARGVFYGTGPQREYRGLIHSDPAIPPGEIFVYERGKVVQRIVNFAVPEPAPRYVDLKILS